MRRKYSHDRLLSLSAQKIPSNHNIFTNSNLSSHLSPLLPTTSIQQEKTVQNLCNSPKLQSIYTIININFPHYFQTISAKPSSITLSNYQQILNNFCRYIKTDYNKSIQCIQDEMKCIEIQLKIVKNDKYNAQQKIKGLQKIIRDKQDIIKNKQYNRFYINEQMFKNQQKLQQISKQLTLKTIQIQQIYTNFQKFKHQAYTSISKHQKISKKLKSQTTKSQQKILNIQNKYHSLLQDHQKQIAYLKQLILSKQFIINKYLHQQPINHSDQHAKFRGFNKTLPDTYKCNPRPNEYVTNTFSPTSNDSPYKSNKRYRVQKTRTNQDLLLQIKQLKQNQSSLLDRIAQRDQIIQKFGPKDNSQMDS